MRGMPPHEVDAIMGSLPVTVVEADEGLAKAAGRLRAQTCEAGLSLGDRFCLALALRDGLPAMAAVKQKELRRMSDTDDYSISDLAELFSISRPTVYRTLGRQAVGGGARAEPA